MLVRESIYFEKGQDPKKAMGIGVVTVSAECGDLRVENNRIDVDADDSSFEFAQYLQEHNIEYEVLGMSNGPMPLPHLKFTGTKEEIIELLMIFFNPGAEKDHIIRRKLQYLFQDWHYPDDEDQLWDILS